MMKLKKRNMFIGSALFAAAVVFLMAFMCVPNVISAPSDNQRPGVSFSHDEHAGEFECLECHHRFDESGEENILDEDELTDLDVEDQIMLLITPHDGSVLDESGVKCVSCHTNTAKLDGMDAYHKMCMGCHKESKKGPALCGECHVNKK